MLKNFRRTVTGLVILALSTSALFAQEAQEVSFAMPPKAFPTVSPLIAEELGLFAKHGIKPNFTYLENTALTITALLSRSADFAQTETTSVISAAAMGQNVVIVARHYQGLSANLILSTATVERIGVSPDAPVEERLAALDGVLLSANSAISSPLLAYKAAANSVGAEPRFTYMARSAAPAALEAGAIEGSLLVSPDWVGPVLRGTAVLWLSPAKGEVDKKFAPSAPVVTATTQEFAAANPDLASKMAAVFDDLSAAVVERPEEVRAAYARLLPEVEEETWNMIFSLESQSLVAQPLTEADIVNDIAFMMGSGNDYGPVDQVAPASVLLQR